MARMIIINFDASNDNFAKNSLLKYFKILIIFDPIYNTHEQVK